MRISVLWIGEHAAKLAILRRVYLSEIIIIL
jgi:hypothetical protein